MNPNALSQQRKWSSMLTLRLFSKFISSDFQEKYTVDGQVPEKKLNHKYPQISRRFSEISRIT